MHREGDESGVSGVGHVLDGVIFHTGQVVVCWRTDLPSRGRGKGFGHSSIGIYESFDVFVALHINSHSTNCTTIEWIDPKSE